jgi:formiminotetrahydrofolate cyclodeaminase
MSLLDLPARELLDRFASPDPTPGGGSAAALAGATGAALVAMVCGMSKTRTGSPEERSRLDTALGWAQEASARLRRLVEDDSDAFEVVLAAYRLPKASEAEKQSRQRAIAEATLRATEVPMDTAEACLVVLRAAAEAAARGNPSALSDVMTGAALAHAGLLGAAENVRINAGSLGDAAGFLEKIEALVRESSERAGALGLAVRVGAGDQKTG